MKHIVCDRLQQEDGAGDEDSTRHTNSPFPFEILTVRHGDRSGQCVWALPSQVSWSHTVHLAVSKSIVSLERLALCVRRRNFVFILRSVDCYSQSSPSRGNQKYQEAK